jgi:hypothetical protein
VTSKSNSSRPAAPAASIVARYHVADHVVRVTKVLEGRWTAAVDENEVLGSYGTQADAWEAGVREVDRLDRAAHRS